MSLDQGESPLKLGHFYNELRILTGYLVGGLIMGEAQMVKWKYFLGGAATSPFFLGKMKVETRLIASLRANNANFDTISFLK